MEQEITLAFFLLHWLPLLEKWKCDDIMVHITSGSAAPLISHNIVVICLESAYRMGRIEIETN